MSEMPLETAAISTAMPKALQMFAENRLGSYETAAKHRNHADRCRGALNSIGLCVSER
jgi:hypothetical protein